MTVTVTTREGKGAKLTHDELDQNFIDLEDAVNSSKLSVVDVDADYTASFSASNVLLCDTQSGDIVVTLPDASQATNVVHYIKKVDSSSSTVTIDPTGSQTIDGALSYVVTTQYEVVKIICDGLNWYLI